MPSYQIKQSSTECPLVFLLVQSSDHITGLTGASPTVTLSKSGAAFASPSGSVTEIANGWYKVAANATDCGTLGPLVLHATATSGDPSDMLYEVVAHDVQDAVHLGLSSLPNTACTTNASLLTSGSGTDQVSVSSGKVLLQATQTGVTIPTVTTVTNQLTGASIATSVWQDATAGDFTTASSIGKSLYTTGNAPGAASGLALVGSNMGTASNALTGAQTATAVWQDATAGDFTTASSIGKSLYTTGNAPGAASGLALVGSNMGSASSVTAAVTVSLSETLSAARALDSVADTSLTLNDAMHCAIAGAAGKETVSGTTFTVKTPSTATTLRTFTLDSGSAPTQRS
jgi:hypothetical protein